MSEFEKALLEKLDGIEESLDNVHGSLVMIAVILGVAFVISYIRYILS